jgi:hypothetical protein
MPKKSRRAKAKHRAAVARAVQERQPQQPRPLPAETQSGVPRVSPKVQDSASRYQYVVPDVKRIGIIAGSIIVILIILSFVLG